MPIHTRRPKYITLLLFVLSAFFAPALRGQQQRFVYGSDTFHTAIAACQAFIQYEYGRDDSLSQLQSGPKEQHTGTPIQQSAKWYGVQVQWVRKFENDSERETKVVDSIIEVVYLGKLPGLPNAPPLGKTPAQKNAPATTGKQPTSVDTPLLIRKIKKFPTGSYVLEQAKLYQAKFSGNADSSYELRKVSFDAVNGNTLIDAKYGHGKSLFEEETYDVTNLNRATKLVDQALRQRVAIKGTRYNVEWHVSTQLGADGLRRLFQENNVDWIRVIHTPM